MGGGDMINDLSHLLDRLGRSMEEMSPAVTVPFMIGNSLCDSHGNTGLAARMEITRLKIITDTATTAASAATSLLSCPDEGDSETNMEASAGEVEEEEVRTAPATATESEEDDAASVDAEQVIGCESGGSSVEDVGVSEAATVSVIGGEEAGAVVGAGVEKIGDALVFEVAVVSDGVAANVVRERRVDGALVSEYVPLWGCASICGRRPEMEDAFAVVPWFSTIPLRMLTGERVVDGLNLSSSHLNAHFFGVYDGHGGAQVANYCKERMHFALVEEVGNILKEGSGSSSSDSGCGVDWTKQWEKVFTRSFLKVDDEVGGIAGRSGVGPCHDGSEEICVEPVAPETVGSTAVVALVCSTHIVIANCGDSRAVLLRGKQPVPLSVDHKPNRESEYTRIEAAGGKVIQWNGYRVFGVLAMSRSIGDRYLKPWIIPDPEVTFVPRMREDECLILASDGLWDVMTNEEVCDVARRRILIWHKKNGVIPSVERGICVDPAAQAAADYLSKLAIQKGSKDNITVIVVDLKAQRKFKSKT
ncbi:putative protein phosphatase 2C 6 [Acorus gramineus]|uniref:protein-serine/threonine phosphatase n=1 Tax=Acorus gramineus TaxID=55184 RepID=A0AAV9AMJ7_ACOGR|nr:putative protein phosphatase 2C 6 [Acorus gramineus]